jgi:hypothetical protein
MWSMGGVDRWARARDDTLPTAVCLYRLLRPPTRSHSVNMTILMMDQRNGNALLCSALLCSAIDRVQ